MMYKTIISKSNFLKLIIVPILLLTIFAMTISATCARTLTIQDNFNSITLSRATVAIEDHPEQNPWEFEGNIKQIRCTGGILTLAALAGGGELKMYTKEIFKSGDFRAKIRLNNAGQGINMYMGFVEISPWHNRSAWVMFNDSSNGHLYMKNGTDEITDEDVMRVRTGELAVGEWYDLHIQLDATGSRLWINGQLHGELSFAKAIPHGGLRGFFSLYGATDCSFSIDEVEITGDSDDNTGEQAAQEFKPVPIPVPHAVPNAIAILSEEDASVSADTRKALLENKFFRVELSFTSGMQITEMVNKYIGKNILMRPSEFFAVHQKDQRLKMADFRVMDVQCADNEKGKQLTVFIENTVNCIKGKITITITPDSPELLIAPIFTNTADRDQIFSVTCPIIEGIQIGEDPAADEFFYPMESGMAGKMDCDIRHVYGMTTFMQLMSVFNAKTNGGVYAYTRDTTGFPSIMLIKRNNEPGTPKSNYVVVPWQLPGSNHSLPIFGDEPGTSIAWRHFEYSLTAGQEAALPEATIGVNSGIWHAGLKSYSEFAHTWFKKRYETPRWYIDCYAMLSTHPYSGLWMFSKPTNTGYYSKERKEYTYGKSITHLERNAVQEMAFFWHIPENLEQTTEELSAKRIPFINAHMIGDYKYHERRGGLKALREEVALIHSKQSRVMFYSFPQGCSIGTDTYKTVGKQLAKMDFPGHYQTSYTTDESGYFLCDHNIGFSEYYAPKLAKIVKETDCDGFRLDVMSRFEPCFNPAHLHYDGTLRSTVSTTNLAKNLCNFKDAFHKVSPEKVVTVEHGASDFLCQFHDGYFSENINWISESPQWANYRKLNAYMLVFTRFYFPEVKTWIHGPSNTELGITMSLFNACGFACTSSQGIRSFRTLEENGDAFDSDAENIPCIPTLVPGVFANYFPGILRQKTIWTILNRSGQLVTRPLAISTPEAECHFVELYNDVDVNTIPNGEKSLTFELELPNNQVAVIAQFPKILSATKNGDLLTVHSSLSGQGYSCQVIRGVDDFIAAPVEYNLTDGKLELPIKGDSSKFIIKLYKGKYLVDEIIR